MQGIAAMPTTHDEMHSAPSADAQALRALLDIALNPPAGSGGAFTAIASGNWFDASTWDGGRIPNVADAFVTIPEGVAVTYNGVSDTPLAMVRVDGTLRFATDINTKLTVDTLGVGHEGRLEIGTVTNPIAANVRADIIIQDSRFIDRIDHVEGDLDNDATQLSLGIISEGSVSIYGIDKTDHLKVATDPMAGSNKLTLASAPTGWQVGDKILVAGTHFVPTPWNVDPTRVEQTFKTEDETFTITAINGNQVTLNGVLRFDHDTPAAEFKTSVANMTRNVEIRSAAPDELATRGHTMFIDNPDVDIQNAAFTDLGRTDKSRDVDDYVLDGPETPEDYRIKLDGEKEYLKTDAADVENMRGRYSLHIHHTGVELGVDQTVIVKGNVVDGSPGWGIAQHDSIALIENNVTFSVFGSGIVAESGNENGAWRYNLAVKTPGRHKKNYDDVAMEKDQARNQDFGITGTGFWFQGRYLAAIENISASSGGAGYFFLHRGVDNEDPAVEALPMPEIGHANATIPVHEPPIDAFIGNESIADAMGLNIIGNEAPRLNNDGRSIVQNFKAWEFGIHGVTVQYSAHYTFKDIKLYGSVSYTQKLEGGFTVGTSTEDLVLNRATIANVPFGIVTRDNFTEATQLALFNELDQALVDTITDYGQRFVDVTFGPGVGKRLDGRKAQPGSAFKPLKYDIKNSADLPNLPLTLTLNDASLKAVWADAAGNLVQRALLTGTKTDSFGTVAFPNLHELIPLDRATVDNLLTEFGYFTAGGGQRVILVNTVYSDRLTGDSKILTHTVEVAADWQLPAEARFLGALPDVTAATYSNLLIIANNPIISFPAGNAVYYAAGLRNAALPDTIFTRGTIKSERITGDATPNLVHAWGGADTVDGAGGNDTLIGGNGDDTVTGGDGDDRAYGGDGEDVVSGGNGNDIVVGDDGNDILAGDAGNDTVTGGAGHDVLSGDADEIVGGNDSLSGGAGNDTLNGAAGADTLRGDEGDDSLTGGAGSDVIAGGTGADRVFAGAGNDVVAAEDGDDFVDGGEGNDSLDGGVGIDTVSFATASGGISASLRTFLATGAGSDTIVGFERLEGSQFADSLTGDAVHNTLWGGGGNDKLEGGEGNDILDGGAGFDIASYAGAAGFVVVSLANQGTVTGTRSAGNDTLLNVEGLEGSAFNDQLTGDANANLLAGGGGDDRLLVSAGADTLDGGDGFDTADFTAGTGPVAFALNAANGGSYSGGGVLTSIEDIEASQFNDRFTSDAGGHMFDGNGGDDIAEGGGGADTLDGGDGIDTLSYALAGAAVTASFAARTATVAGIAGSAGVTGFEVLVGSNFGDVLSGGVGADTIRGGGGSDTLTGGASDDMLEGGDGDDVLNGGDGSDTLDGGAGFDRVVFNGAATGLTLSLAVLGSQLTSIGPVTLRGIEAITGSAREDQISGDDGANQIDGAAANDTLFGAGGGDMLTGGFGNDVLDGGLGNDVLDGSDGIDTASYANAAAAITASQLTGLVAGGAGNDTLVGIEVVEGSAFNDTLIGDDGADTLRGAGGNDVLEGGLGNDALDGGLGLDTASYATATSAVAVSLAVLGNQNTRGAGIDALSGIEVLLGSAFNDTLNGDDGSNTLTGGSGDDVLDGDVGNDLLAGGLGVDTASYQSATAAVAVSLAQTAAQDTRGAGLDILSGIENLDGSAFNDTLTGDGGANTLSGGDGNDTLTGGIGNDVLLGEAGDDVLGGGVGDDTLVGGLGIDTATYADAATAVTVSLASGTASGGGGLDSLATIEVVIGSSFADSLSGGAGNDTLRGGGGNDTLAGANGNDQLEGGDGDDWLNGGIGDDTLLGGNGLDTAAFTGTTAVRVSLALAGQLQNTIGAGLLVLDGIERLVGTNKDDTLIGSVGANTLDGGLGNDLLDGGAGSDVLVGGDGNDTVTYAAATAGVNASLLTSIATGGGGADALSGIEAIEGSAFDDTLAGDDGADTLLGAGGNDWLGTSDGNDLLDGGSGIDTVSFAAAAAGVAVSLAITVGQNTRGAGIDTIAGVEIVDGSAFNDTLTGAAGNETLRGGAGDDLLDGGAGNDSLDGGTGFNTVTYANSGVGSVTVALLADGRGSATGIGGIDSFVGIDAVVGSAGGDLLRSDGGNHRLDGGSGNDTLSGGAGDDTLIGGVGIDTATYADATSAVTVSLAAGVATGGGGNDTLGTIEVVIGSGFADSLSGGTGDDTLIGGGGADTLTGGAGNDSLDGGDGDDWLVGAGSGNDSFAGGAGFDTASFAGSALGVGVTIQGGIQTIATGLTAQLADIEALVGSARDDRLTGNTFANALTGGSGNDTLSGGGGNDTLEGGFGGDSLVGGTGNDVFIFGAGAGSDVIQDFAAGDVVMFQGFGALFDTAAEVLATRRASGADSFVRLTHPDGTTVTVTFQGVDVNSLDASDFLFA